MKRKAGIIGAGKTGRGYIARLLRENDIDVVFFDKDEQHVDNLNYGYKVTFFSERTDEVQIDSFHALSINDEKCQEVIGDLSLLFVSVGYHNLSDVGKWISDMASCESTFNKSEYYFILCENAIRASEILKKSIFECLEDKKHDEYQLKFKFTDAAVFCTTIQSDINEVDIVSENLSWLPYDQKQLAGYDVNINSFEPVDDLSNLMLRKLYTYNAASAIIAYLGWLKGYTDFASAANDSAINRLLDYFYLQIGIALCKEYGYKHDDQNKFAQMSKNKFCNKSIKDSIYRNARFPYNKISPDERIIAPALLIERHGGDNSVLAMTAAALLLYEDPCDKNWGELKLNKSYEEILSSISCLNEQGNLYKCIIKYIHKFTSSTDINEVIK